MPPYTIDNLKETLVAILSQKGKNAICWKSPFTISMTEDVAILLYKILGMENGGWTKVEQGHNLNGCSCKTARIIKNNGTAFGKANKQIIYRDFQPCSTHASEIFELFKQANISTKEMDWYIKIKNSPELLNLQEIEATQPLFGWHDGVHIIRGALTDGKRR